MAKTPPTARPSEQPPTSRSHMALGGKYPPAPVPTARPVRLRVQAIKKGFYDLKRRRVGDVFTIPSQSHFSKVWMQVVPDHTPERITTGAQDLQQQHDEILGAKFNRAAATAGIVGPSDDLGAGEKSPLDD